MVWLAFESPGTAGNGLATEGAEGVVAAAFLAVGQVVPVPVNVACDEEIEATVAIVVAPGCAAGPVAQLHTGLLRDIGKCPVVIVVVEAVLAHVRYKNVGPAIVVKVGNGHTGTPAVIRHACLRCYIGKRAIVVVAKQCRVRRSSLPSERVHR